MDAARRRELSPSPEVDLSSPEFDDMDDDIAMPTTPIGSLSLRALSFGPGAPHMSHHTSTSTSRNQRASSPPLEKDEKEFTQTADGLQKRKMSGELLSASSSVEMDFGNKDDSGLFGEKTLLSVTTATMAFMTSPAIRPSVFAFNPSKKEGDADSWTKLDNMVEWDRSPENIELDELDGLLLDY
jgi:hypothetical protein